MKNVELSYVAFDVAMAEVEAAGCRVEWNACVPDSNLRSWNVVKDYPNLGSSKVVGVLDTHQTEEDEWNPTKSETASLYIWG